MVIYTCRCCDYTTHIKTHYNKHLKTKKHLDLAEISPKLAKISHKLAKISHENMNYVCKYCDKVFKHQSSLCKHIKYTCKKNEDEDLKELVKLMNEKIENMEQNYKKTQKMLENEIVKRDKKITKLSNKLQINNNNCIIQNTNIQLLNYKDTDISHLTKDDYINSIKRINNCVKTITEKIHYNPEKPENMNIYISNLKNDYVTVYENGEWVLKKGIEDVYDHKEILLEEWLDKEQNNYPELRDKFEKYLNNKDNDNILNNIKDDIKLMMYNNKPKAIKNT
tara:strand:- start:250 stop:1089 length:840 start_codon:yes stop_codon:yes gene_type:complete